MRLARRVFAVGALAALEVAVAPGSGAQTPTVTSVIGSADGLSASIDVADVQIPAGTEDGAVSALETVVLGPIPTVTLPPERGAVSDEVIGFHQPVSNGVTDIVELGVDLLRTAAEGATGPNGFATAESTLESLSLDLIDTLTLVSATSISATCSADLEGVTGSTTLVDANVLGVEVLPEQPAPNTQILNIEIPDVASANVTAQPAGREPRWVAVGDRPDPRGDRW